MVDSPFLKLEVLGSNKDCSSIVGEVLEHQMLEDLGERGSIETDRSLSAFCFGLATLGTGEMLAVFQMHGNCELENFSSLISSNDIGRGRR